jgi:hypothetical protein
MRPSKRVLGGVSLSGISFAGLRVDATLGDGEGCGDDRNRTEDEQKLIPTALVGEERPHCDHVAERTVATGTGSGAD